MDNKIIVVFKEIGKRPIPLKINNNICDFINLTKGNFTFIKYNDYAIVYNKSAKHMPANIYLNRNNPDIYFSIRGNIFAIGLDNYKGFISLNKMQAIDAIKLFTKESFYYKSYYKRSYVKLPKIKKFN